LCERSGTLTNEPFFTIHRATLGEVKIALRIGLKVEHELMEVRRDLHHVVEGFVEIRLPVLIAVLQADNPVAAGDVDGVLDDAQPKRLVQARGESFPADVAKLRVDARTDPDIAGEGGEGDPAVLEEVDPAHAQPGMPRVVHGQGDRVQLKSPVLLTHLSHGGNHLRPQ
jgi:hypothetical protein